MNPCIQFLLGTRLGRVMVGTGWLGLVTAGGYMVVDHQITVTTLHSILTSLTPMIAAALAGGGVHFIYNKNGNGKNGNGNGGAH